MRVEQVWSVIRVTARGAKAHIELGHRPTTSVAQFGPAFVTTVEDAPHIGDKISLTYTWGEDYAAPVTKLRSDGTDGSWAGD